MTGFDAASFLRNLTELPGVYQMYDAAGGLLYVGKARNLRKRVASYFRGTGLGGKTEALVARIAEIQVTVTGSETEALLLEQNLIKSQHPPYNILLRDDKSYPVHLPVAEGDLPAARLPPRRQARDGALFRSVSQLHGGAREPEPAAEDLPRAPVRGQLLPQPLAALPAVPDRALLGSLRGAGG